MRYLKITSAENPDNDYIELNDFNGFLCTSFTTLGISRQYEMLAVGNRQFSVDNKPKFKDYSLTVHILTKYSLYEAKYNELITFLDRNKESGFRLYFNPYSANGNDERTRYILCDIKSTAKTEKLQPVILTITQNSLWFGKLKYNNIVSVETTANNAFDFKKDESEIDDYYCAIFKNDDNINSYYCIGFVENYFENSIITNDCYNEVPLQIYIYGYCENPQLVLTNENSVTLKQLKIEEIVSHGYYIYIDSRINENGVWLVNEQTGVKQDISEKVYNEYGSPYWSIGHGTYYIKVAQTDNDFSCKVEFNEEYSG